MRSAWLKWARAVEQQRYLARLGREFQAAGTGTDYDRTDNAGDRTDPALGVQWRLRRELAYPERWSVVLGDVVGNLRAALDHAMWSAVHHHSGPPSSPVRIGFPITSTQKDFNREAKRQRDLVAPRVWEIVEALQPLHGQDKAHTAPLEIVRWMSNLDKHRFPHVVARTHVNAGPPVVLRSGQPLEILRFIPTAGPIEPGGVVATARLARPTASGGVDLVPTFAHYAAVQTSDEPVEYRALYTLMPNMTDLVLQVLVGITEATGADCPDGSDLELGAEHDAFAAKYGGDVWTWHGLDGTTRRLDV